MPTVKKKKPVKKGIAVKAVDKILAQRKKDEAKQKVAEAKYETIGIRRQKDFRTGRDIVSIVIVNEEIKDWLQNHTNDERAYQSTPVFNPQSFITYLEEMKRAVNEGATFLQELISFLEYDLKEILVKSAELSAKDQITFDLLWTLFPKGSSCYTYDEEQLSAGIVDEIEYRETWFANYFEITVNQIDTDGKGFYKRATSFKIRSFDGVLSIKDLSVKKMNDEVKAKLIERGKKFQKYGIGSNYVQYAGNLMWREWWGNVLHRSNGRLMIDVPNFDKANPSYNDGRRTPDRDNSNSLSDIISEDMLHVTVPFIKAFSFPLKKWGEIALDNVEAIKFNDKAFETLVLEPEKKQLISALVKHSDVGFTDIIKGKSGGCIFLLHGPPGVGKTLTSEAIAETMHAPLYSVSVGELGINPAELETKLRDILDLAATWKAQILIDEADIFLEKRNEQDIVRNAMVGVFLRLLEYHQGVLFLTTNRVKNIDEAFYSRISIALHYESLDNSHRVQIWENLLKCAGVEGIDVKALAKHEINGRQIKTTIRLAQAIAKEKNEKVGLSHIMTTIKLQEQFVKDLK